MKPIRDHYHPPGHGSETTERLYEGWFKTLCDAAGDSMKEGVVVCDYGSGPCALANYLSQRFEKFTYYGLEPNSEYGREVIGVAQEALGHDPRVHLGHLETELHDEALKMADVVILGSIFTHLSCGDFYRTMNSLLPVTKHLGKVVFSIFLGPNYKLVAPNIYSMPNVYGRVELTHGQFNTYWADLPEVMVEQTGQFITKHGDNHLIYVVERY